MFITVEGVYRNDKVEPLEVPDEIAADESVERRVLVTFLSPTAVNLQARGITEAQAAKLRTRLATFAEDWSDESKLFTHRCGGGANTSCMASST